MQLMEGERIVEELRQGVVQRVATDVLKKKTIVLTNKRLMLFARRAGSYGKIYLFLKDIQGLESFRIVNIKAFIFGLTTIFAAFMLVFVGMVGETISSDQREICLMAAPVSAVVGLVALIGFGKLNALRISTTTEDIDFVLDRSLSTERLDSFVNKVQQCMDKVK